VKGRSSSFTTARRRAARDREERNADAAHSGITAAIRHDCNGMTVIVNSGAGARDDGKRVGDRIRRHFEESGVEPRVLEPDATHNLSALAREAAQNADDTIVAAGGDGTVSAVASQLVGTNKTLGVLPIGTLNHFAKDLRIPLDLAAAVRTVVHGRVTSVDAAEVNGRIFINNSSLGLYPRIVSKREEQQERLGRGKWPAFLWATMHALRRFPFLDLHIDLEGKQLARRTAFLFVGNNEYQIAGFNLGARTCIDRGNLGLYLTHRTGRFGLFRLAIHALFGRVDQAEDFEAFCVREARIDARKRRLLVACDGEIMWMQTPLHYRSRENALRVLVPNEEPAP
jgi:diacylglycerol kinase family enzyme